MTLLKTNYIQNKDAKDIITDAILELTNVVTSTLGPRGNTVVIPSSKEYGKFLITKDGVSVAEQFSTGDRYKDVIIDLAKQVAKETVKEAGDGTTTSMLFVQELLTRFKNTPFTEKHDIDLRKIVSEIEKSSRMLELDEVYKVALISANGDTHIAETIGKAFTSRHSSVIVKEHNSFTDKVETTNGLLIPGEPLKGFEHTAGRSYNNTLFAIHPQPITDIKRLNNLFQISRQKPVVIMTSGIDDSIVNIIVRNNLNVSVIKTPGFADHRENLAQDIATYTGCKIIDVYTDTITEEHYVVQKNITLGKNTIILNDKNTESVAKLIKTLTDKLDGLDEHPRDLIEQRIARLGCSNATILVGGLTEVEAKERFDRYEDAVRAVTCALEQGVIQGGGAELVRICERLLGEISKEFVYVLTAPYNKLSNKGEFYQHTSLSKDIVDPVKVTITALTRAYSFVKTIQSTNSIILGEYGK